MLRMHQKIKWTRTELQKFAEYDGLECEVMLMAEDGVRRHSGGLKAVSVPCMTATRISRRSISLFH